MLFYPQVPALVEAFLEKTPQDRRVSWTAQRMAGISAILRKETYTVPASTQDRPAFCIGDKAFSPRNPLIIAEIGTSHAGDPAQARSLLRAARDAGADCAKFQLVYADEIIHPATGLVPLPGGKVRLYDRFRELEQPLSFFQMLKAEAEALGLLFLCTPFGLRSAAELASLGVMAMKSASPELNHLPLLDALAKTGLPLILSTGVSLLADIEAALEMVGYPGKRAASSLLLLHCVTAYPAPCEDYNLRAMANLGSILGLPMGVSDHSEDPVLVPLLALACGACAVEKHFTLDRSGGGLDDPIALSPGDFSRMAGELRSAAGLGRDEIIARASALYGTRRVEAVLGDGVKRLAPSERENYGRTNRSIHALKPIRTGEILSRENLGILRTEKVLRPGLAPAFMPLVLGRLAARDVEDGQGLGWEDVGGRA